MQAEIAREGTQLAGKAGLAIRPQDRMSRRSNPEQKRSRARQRALLDAAEEILGEVGADGLKMREVARRANLPIASVYHYFPSAAALIRTLVERMPTYPVAVAVFGDDLGDLPAFDTVAALHIEHPEVHAIRVAAVDAESPAEVEQERDQTEPQADGDSNDVDSSPGETVADETIVDGRVSGLPPNYETEQNVDGADSPALDAEIQSDERRESEEG